jgi:hypothetical protein
MNDNILHDSDAWDALYKRTAQSRRNPELHLALRALVNQVFFCLALNELIILSVCSMESYCGAARLTKSQLICVMRFHGYNMCGLRFHIVCMHVYVQ